jgi:HEPN domain-containing protein
VTNVRLGESYIERATARLPFLRQMQAAGLHADVVRESQEAVELALKGLLRIVGIDPPKNTT